MDRFLNRDNAQLPRFYSKFRCPGSEGVDAFSVPWAGENNFLFPESLIIITLPLLGDRGTFVVPAWPSAPFWPLIFTEGLSSIIADVFEIPMGTDVFCLGNYQGALFGSPNFRSGVIFLRILC